MAHDEGAPCRHLGAPPEHLIVQVADLIQKQLSADDKYLASLGLTASEYRSALPAAIERVRGSWAASNENSRDFVEVLLSELVSQNIISDYEKPRYGSDTIYKVALRSGQKIAVIQKGCPDGSHSSTQWSRPSWAHETYLWWLCSSQRYHPGEHIWKGVGRLRQKVSEGSDQLDGIIFYNELCGTGSRPCPKIDQAVEIEGKRYPPPCIYVFPKWSTGVREMNWRGLDEKIFPSVLLSLFGISKTKATDYISYVGFQLASTRIRTEVTNRFGAAKVTTTRD